MTNLQEVPKRVIVIGGGVVACESTTWLNGLGAEVTILQRGGSLLATNEPFAGEMVADSLRELGVTVRLNAHVESVSRPGVQDTGIGRIHGGPVEVVVDGETLTADEIVVATGRVPRQQEHRPGHGRAGRDGPVPRRIHQRRRPPHGHRRRPGRGRALAVRDRRHQRPRAAHPHGQVPGPDLRGGHRRPRRRPLGRRSGDHGPGRPRRDHPGDVHRLRRSPRSG